MNDLLTTVEPSCSIEAGSDAMGIASGGRALYAFPGMDGRPGVPVLAVIFTGPVFFTCKVRSSPPEGGSQ